MSAPGAVALVAHEDGNLAGFSHCGAVLRTLSFRRSPAIAFT
jgi:hypothetical protein